VARHAIPSSVIGVLIVIGIVGFLALTLSAAHML
jgi:hypothetical protein